MDNFIDPLSPDDMIKIIENIERYLLINDHENAFISFLLHTERLNSIDKASLIRHFKNHFKNKYKFGELPTKK
jgi:hypothetical protein